MEIFADTADVSEIAKWLRRGVIDGVTTNPSIMLKDGVRDIEKGAREIAEILGGRPLSVEVIGNDPFEMLAQARESLQCAQPDPALARRKQCQRFGSASPSATSRSARTATSGTCNSSARSHARVRRHKHHLGQREPHHHTRSHHPRLALNDRT